MTSGSVRSRNRSTAAWSLEAYRWKGAPRGQRSASVFETSSTLPEGVAGITESKNASGRTSPGCAPCRGAAREGLALRGEVGLEGTAERYAAYLCQSPSALASFDRINSIQPLLSTRGSLLPGIRELDLGQRAPSAVRGHRGRARHMANIKPQRVLSDLHALATFGTYKTGVHRPTLSASDIAARAMVRVPDA
jgi:hypothetical protein